MEGVHDKPILKKRGLPKVGGGGGGEGGAALGQFADLTWAEA